MKNPEMLPVAIINHNTVLKVVASNPGCSLRDLFITFVSGKMGGSLKQVKDTLLALIDGGYVRVRGYAYDLTDLGKEAIKLLKAEEAPAAVPA